jgi:DNA-binding NarL/FixJ family response regulator
MEKITILIADDHKLLRETWGLVLSTDPRFEVVAECSNGTEAVELAKQKRPDVVLMDINMTPMNGFEATEQIRRFAPASNIIGLSMHSQPAYAKKIMQLGARGYVTKNSSREEMVKAILEVTSGNKYLCDEVKNIITEQMMEDRHEPSLNMLSEREMDIVNFIKKGASSKEIAEALHISIKTVEVHRHNILKKLNLKNVAALVNFINTNGEAF